QVARMVGVRHVYIPPRPGLGCAIGLLQTAVRHNYMQSAMGMLDSYSLERMNELFGQLRERALAEAAEEGFAAPDVNCRFQLEMRYRHQGYQLQVDAPYPMTAALKPTVKRAFDSLHQQIYGQCAEDEDAEIVSFRVQSEIRVPQLELPELAAGDGKAERAVV